MSRKHEGMDEAKSSVTFLARLPFGSTVGLLTSPTVVIGDRVNTMVAGIELESLVESSARGDTAAWRALREDVEPWLEKLVANPRFLGRLGQREDDRANIIVEVMARLYAA